MKFLMIGIAWLLLFGCANAEKNNNISGMDICEILQLTVNLPKLQKYYHVDKKSQRKPLRLIISDKKISCQLLTKFGISVLLTHTKSQKRPYLQINKIKSTLMNVDIEYEYQNEGIRGKATFTKDINKWNMVTDEVFEM